MKWQKSHRIDDEAISKKKLKKNRGTAYESDVGSEDARPPRVINCFIRFPNKYSARTTQCARREGWDSDRRAWELRFAPTGTYYTQIYMVYTAPRDAWLPPGPCLHNPFENHLRNSGGLAQRVIFFRDLFMRRRSPHRRQWVTEPIHTLHAIYMYNNTYRYAGPGAIWCEKDLKVDIDKWGARRVRAHVARLSQFRYLFFFSRAGIIMLVCLKEI